MRKRRFLFLFTVALFLLTACGRGEKQYVIGVSQCSEDIWRDKLNGELVMSTYQHENVKLEFASAGDNDELQTEQIQRFIDEGVDLIIVSPNQIHTISSVIDKAYGKGIPVILFDRKTDSNNYTAFIGADNYEVGRQMGDFIARQLGGRGNIAEICGLKGSSPAIERHKGFMDAISRYPGIKLVARRYAGWLKERGRVEMDSILLAGTKVDYVFAQNDRMGIGARQSAWKHGAKNIRFVGIDALPSRGGGLEQVRDGHLVASYIYPTRGDIVMQLALNILEGKPYRRDNYLKGALVTRDNAGVLLLQNEELDKQSSRLKSLHGKVNDYLAQYNHQQIYMLLSAIIILLLIGLIAYIYHTLALKRRMEEKATNAKLQFFTNVSHEIRTPLTLIADPIDHLQHADNLTPRQQDMLRIVHRNIDVLMRLVNEILEFRKVQNGKMTLSLSDFDLAISLRQWAEVFEEAAAAKKAVLSLELPERLMMHADIYKVERICYNLLNNAVKYCAEGSRVVVSAHEEGGNACIRVANDGQVIPREELSRVFERFYQAGNAKGGTGIGLALVKAFAELQGGTVRATSDPGGLTEFTVTIPLQVVSAAESTASAASPAASGPTRDDQSADDLKSKVMVDRITEGAEEKPSILVIDDNADIRAYMMAVLSDSYEVTESADGAEGLRRALRDVPDLIVCDVMMPVMDGLEFCRRIKADPITSHIPVILLTARIMEEHRAQGYEQGADAYLTKPFSSEVLKARIGNLLLNRKRMKLAFAAEGDHARADSPAASAEPKSMETEFIDRFRRLMQEKLAAPDLNVDQLSSDMGISRAQLYRKIKALTGYSPVEVIREARLKRAKRLLETTDKSISEVAYAVGFSTPSYFTKCYRERFGKNPGSRE
ncbi:substrate-binding domain-containing protein [Prevotella sp. KH2C16]|uniref:substrate-binding domain-containing protein n=1 Tax=Prevotella sp. KH2C16 TaxID=1855325 RepID=UPI0008E28840|nr:substrate-binding domain-containing protein [Prevotella sp. KH2C16]SFG20947.1 Signal transduction histidine kinase [Prevotella sp. KH2C16]